MNARRIVIGLVTLAITASLAVLLFYPYKNAPSGFEWLVAMIEGRGKPHYHVAGSAESRMEDLFNRHPRLRPQWRDVPDEENRFLKLREFVESEELDELKLGEALRQTLDGDIPWDTEIAAAYLEEHREMIDALREIAMLPGFSAAGVGYNKLSFISARPYKTAAEALSVSMRQHLHQGNVEAAHRDFSAQYQMAASVEQIEVTSTLASTVGVLCRMSAIEALNQSLSAMPPDTDWTEWIRLIQNEKAPGILLAHAIRGEVACSIGGLILPFTFMPGENNSIWNFEAFEDGYAVRVISAAYYIENAKTLTEQDLADLEKRWMMREAGVGKEAREMLDTSFFGMGKWISGYMRFAARHHQTLAALQLLEIERTTGPILAADDPRLAALAVEPFSGLAFVFDPEGRRLLSDPASALNTGSEKHRLIQLPPLK